MTVAPDVHHGVQVGGSTQHATSGPETPLVRLEGWRGGEGGGGGIKGIER